MWNCCINLNICLLIGHLYFVMTNIHENTQGIVGYSPCKAVLITYLKKTYYSSRKKPYRGNEKINKHPATL